MSEPSTPSIGPREAPPLRPPATRPEDPLRGILLVLAATCCFSVSDALAKVLAQTLPPIEVAWLRYVAFVALTLLPLARRGGLRVLRSRQPGLQVLRGVGVVGSAVAFTAAVQALPLAEATAINFVSPAFITVLAILFLGEQVGWRRWAAIVVGLVGVLIVVRPGSGAMQAAAIFPVLTAASWACAVIVTRKMAGVDPPATTLLWSAGVGLVLLSLLVPFVWITPSWPEVALGFLIGAVSTAGHGLVVLAYRVAQASVLAPFSYAQLLTSTLAGLAMFGAVPDGWTLVGAAVIVASGLYTAHRERLRARERQRAAHGPRGGRG